MHEADLADDRFEAPEAMGVDVVCRGLSMVRGDEGKVEVGKKAPDITLQATSIGMALPEKKNATTLSLKDFEGKKNVVLFFFPKANTTG